ncbi:AarF/ABC1/UbiB kinase family protein [Candidatus Woesearchaeota archaeon]|nr:AarF/ABC1/UbiB kinase family protein [Candidatus Woesearchaeota archaeon]
MLKKEIADFKRFKDILTIIFEEGFSFFLSNLKLRKHIPLKKQLKKKKIALTNEKRLRRVLERLGPTFVKFGQILSIRPDFVPKNYIKELEKLQNEVKPVAFSDIKRAVVRSTGKKIESTFKSFDEKPLASASIAQVHKAVLKTGEVVAVKVRRPGIKRVMRSDIEIMHFLAALAEKHNKGIRKYNPVSLVKEFSQWTGKELDFRNETENLQLFKENFKHSTSTMIPEVYPRLCTEEIIVMEFIDGIELSKVHKHTMNIKEALVNGFYSVLEQVFVHGLFHGDPHPSNIFVLPDDRVGFVDLGIVGRFDDELKNKATDLFIAITEGETERVVESLMDLGIVDEGIDVIGFKSKIREVIYPFTSSSIRNIKISRVLEEVWDTALDYGIRMPRDFVLMGKAIVTLEGVGLLYYPDFRFAEMTRPFLKRLLVKRYTPTKVLKGMFFSLFAMKKSLEKIPAQATRVLDKLEQGRIKIEMKDTDVERLSTNIDKSSNRVAYAMILAALLVSGSLVINLGEPFFAGLPVASLIIFGLASVISLFLLVSIFREGR